MDVNTGSANNTGINQWWAYEGGALPGVGNYMVNVANGNLVVESTDVDVPERGINLTFHRVYNSLSQRDWNASGQSDDGSPTPGTYGTGWTNTFDTHMALNNNGMTVFDTDGARYDYTYNGTGCLTAPAGMHNILCYDGGCGFTWTKQTGTIYYYYAPWLGTNCGSGGAAQAALSGRLWQILGKNHNNHIDFYYFWINGDASNSANLTQITALHSDGQQLVLSFGTISAKVLLSSITRPDGQQITYLYPNPAGNNNYGNLEEVDLPGNNQGTIKHQYGYYASNGILNWVASPRWFMSGQTEGAYTWFNYDGGSRISGVQLFGYSNFAPADGTGAGALQPNYTTGYQQISYAGFSYPSSSETSFSDSDGHAANWFYDAAGRVTQTQAWSGSLWLVTGASWDSDNNLTQSVDARGFASDFAYDSNGNLIAAASPTVTTNQGSFRATTLYSYDRSNGANNIAAVCDPVRAHAIGQDWSGNPGTSDSLCPNSTGSTRYVWDYSDSAQPFGRLTDTYTATGYHRSYAYNTGAQGGDFDLPSDESGDCIVQADGNNRCPHQTLGYDTLGNLTSYNTGNGTWNLSYDSENHLATATDPDGYTSYKYYYANGQLSKSENSYQHTRGVAPTFSYDDDGNLAQEINYRGGTYVSGGTPGLPSTPPPVQKFYDGADRLVEVLQPRDPNGTSEAYTNAWITRYIYDISQNGSNGPRPILAGQTLVGYGNLVETQEELPNADVVVLNSSGTTTNGTFKPTKGNSFDALDRPIARFYFTALNGQSNTLEQEITTYDAANPVSGNNVGNRSQVCNALSQCEYYAYDSRSAISQLSYTTNSDQNQTFTYDAAGRITSIYDSAFGTQSYAYDGEGHKTQSIEPTGGSQSLSSPATLTYHYYGDGMRSSLDVSSSALAQNGLFSYSYRADGKTEQYQINLNSNAQVGTTSLNFVYSAGGRIQQRTESGTGANATPTSYGYDPAYGYLTQVTFPGGSESSLEYDPSGSQLGQVAASGSVTSYTYTLRGELLGQGNSTTSGATKMANGISATFPRVSNGTTASVTIDPQMGIVIGNSTSNFTTTTSLTTTFDAIGRLTQDFYGCDTTGDSCTGASSYTVNRTYDQADHQTRTDMPDFIYSGSSYYDWGPEGRIIRIGQTPPGSSTPSYETLHWDGDQLLFTTNQNGSLDDVKMGSIADVTPLDSSYRGITFWDRDPSSALVYCHNATGSGGNGIPNPRVFYGRLSGIPHYINPCTVGPASMLWWSTPNNTYRVGTNGLLAMPRADGFTDGFNTLQGVRAYDAGIGAWTTPDKDQGNTDNPTSQKSYAWNANDPTANMDASGFDPFTSDAYGMESYTSMDATASAKPDDGQSRKDPPPPTIAHVHSCPIMAVMPCGDMTMNDYWDYIDAYRFIEKEDAIMRAFVGGWITGGAGELLEGVGGVGAAGCRIACKWVNITKSGSVTNIETDQTVSQFGDSLLSQGFKATVSKDGLATVYTKGAAKYSVRAFSKSGPPTADYSNGAGTILKIRLKP